MSTGVSEVVRRAGQQQLASSRVEVRSLLDREQKAPTGPLEFVDCGRARQRVHEADSSSLTRCVAFRSNTTGVILVSRTPTS